MRRPPSRASSLRSSGQVATTIIVAQTTAPRNGWRIQNTATISPTRNRTASVLRLSSRCIEGFPSFEARANPRAASIVHGPAPSCTGNAAAPQACRAAGTFRRRPHAAPGGGARVESAASRRRSSGLPAARQTGAPGVCGSRHEEDRPGGAYCRARARRRLRQAGNEVARPGTRGGHRDDGQGRVRLREPGRGRRLDVAARHGPPANGGSTRRKGDDQVRRERPRRRRRRARDPRARAVRLQPDLHHVVRIHEPDAQGRRTIPADEIRSRDRIQDCGQCRHVQRPLLRRAAISPGRSPAG